MADDADRTADRMELEDAIRRRLAPAPALPYTGFCFNCEDPVDEPLKFCDKDCQQDWETRLRYAARTMRAR